MKKSALYLIISLTFVAQSWAATLYVDANNSTPTAPYNSWATAATTIQDAVDAATTNDLVLVTNGVYLTGGKEILNAGTISNRVAISSGVTVKSVNGFSVTFIQGSGEMGNNATRCAYVADNAILSGFTLTNGTTKTSGSYDSNQAGGGAWCQEFGIITNCVFIKNTAQRTGGGVYGGIIKDCSLLKNNSDNNGGGASESELTQCLLAENEATYDGGGAYYSTLKKCELRKNQAHKGGGASDSWLHNCLLKNNHAQYNGGGAVVAYDGGLENCALIGNSAENEGGGYFSDFAPEKGMELQEKELNNCTLAGNSAGISGGGISSEGMVVLNNCIVYYNKAPKSPNYSSGIFNFSCTTPLPDQGTNNISVHPELASLSHLSTNSPCLFTGSTNYSNGVDFDGEPWQTTPAMGCDEMWMGNAIGLLDVKVTANQTNVTTGYAITFSADVEGQTTASKWIWGDGTVTENRPVISHAFSSNGTYVVELVVYNDTSPLGISDFITIQVGDPVVHYVNQANASPSAPYTSWATAATNIQDAIDSTIQYGAHVLVSNGTYETGSFTIDDSMPNRIIIKEGVFLTSLNGPDVTSIKGTGPIGSNAVRCVYMEFESTLSGFTLTNGHTLLSAYLFENNLGGGAFCENASLITNCVITGNAAYYNGGGVYQGEIKNCFISENSATSGGGITSSIIHNSVLTRNYASISAGGASKSTLINCTVAGNKANLVGGGIEFSTLTNCIVYLNQAPQTSNYRECTFSYSCTTPLPLGTGNIDSDPLLASASHLSTSSPCIGLGNATATTGTDIDGNSWATPPAMGCDEVVSGSSTGSLTVQAEAEHTIAIPNYEISFSSQISGKPTMSKWIWGDGTTTTNQPFTSHSFTSTGTYLVELIVYNDDNPSGVSSTISVQINDPVVHYVNVANASPTPPYTSWATAANQIQDAIDVATSIGASVLVTNGVYDSGGKLTIGLTTNRIALIKGLSVKSVNGPDVTIIKGAGPNGDSAVRCVYLAENSIISGFTITKGATQTSGDYSESQCGGGLWCEDSATVTNCIITENSANRSGGGASYGTLLNCTISNNSATYGGGTSDSVVTDSTLSNNESSSGGGGSSYGTLTRCTIIENHAGSRGGGSDSCSLYNCLIAKNHADTDGGGTYSSTLKNCTVANNSAGSGSSDSGGGTYYGTINNCIIYENTAGDSGSQNYKYGTINYSCTTPAPSGTNNVILNPLFFDSLGGNYQLESSSPCIDVGNNAEVQQATDLNGNVRIQNSIVDMGAYEGTYSPTHYLMVSTNSITYSTPLGTSPSDETFDVWNHETTTLNYNITNDVTWLSCSPITGSSSGEHDAITIQFNTATLAEGSHTGLITVASSEADNHSKTVTVIVNMVNPMNESFEDGMGDWIFPPSGFDYSWSRRSGSTPSSSTGPAGAADGDYYVFTEASSHYNKTFAMQNTFNFSSMSAPKMTFNYHMYGSNMGTLQVDIFDGTIWLLNVWSKTGQQQTSTSSPWGNAEIDLAAFGGKTGIIIRFVGLTGSAYKSDMAVDNIRISSTAPADTDGDGIPDWWEDHYFSGPTNCNPTANADSDAQNNLEEYIAGTNPTNAASFFSLTNITSAATGFVVQWDPSISNREYSVIWTDDLRSNNSTSLISGIDYPQNSYTDTVHNTEGAGFYEIEVKLKP